MGYGLFSDPTRESRSDFPFSRPGRTTVCLTVVPWPHGGFSLSDYWLSNMTLGTTKVKFFSDIQIRRGAWLIKVKHSER